MIDEESRDTDTFLYDQLERISAPVCRFRYDGKTEEEHRTIYHYTAFPDNNIKNKVERESPLRKAKIK